MTEVEPVELRPVEFLPDGVGWDYGERKRGRFHRWGEKSDNITDGHSKLYGAVEVVAIVESDNGWVYEVRPDRLRFLDRVAND